MTMANTSFPLPVTMASLEKMSRSKAMEEMDVIWSQLKALCWKNMIIKFRKWSTLLLELLVPTVLILGVVALTSLIPTIPYDVDVPNAMVKVQTLPELARTAPCQNFRDRMRRNLIWDCYDQLPAVCPEYNMPNSDEEFIRGLGCGRHYIAVAPDVASNVDGTAIAAEFIEWAESNPLFNANLSTPNSTYIFFESEAAIIENVMSPMYVYDRSIPVLSSAIIFKSSYPSWEYTLRLNATSHPKTSDRDVDDSLRTNIDRTNDGRDAAFIEAHSHVGTYTLSNVVNTFVSSKTCQSQGSCSGSEIVKVAMFGAVPFPNPKSEGNGFWGAAGSSFNLLVIISLLYPISNMVKDLVVEKEAKLREGMMMMSLRPEALWGSWIINFVALLFCLSILLTTASAGLFENSSSILVFLYFFVFFLASMCYSIFISIFYSKARTASILACLIFFAGYIIFTVLEGRVDSGLSKTDVMLASLHPATAFCFASTAFREYEDAGIGVTSYTWDVSNTFPITFQDTLMIMFVDCIYLLALSWYFMQIWPNEYGTTKPWYFLFEKKYWVPIVDDNERLASYREVTGKVANLDGITTALVEEVPETLSLQVEENKCIDIRRLYKQFYTATGLKVAVDSLDLTMFHGHITVLLGHNGAGKTTTIGMLTGLIPADGGTAIVEGYDLNQDMQAIRRKLGVCPQHDILFPLLTVEEHLFMFASIKGMKGTGLIDEEVDRMVKAVGLTEKRKELSMNLSGGQKRKLSVAIAFIGNSKVVFLDEPTSGMDPYSRRFIWNVIRQYKEGRTIVLTTHFMDEADLLGDRIAIMGGGKLKCCGSSLYLKKAFGVGYNMTFEKTDINAFERSSLMSAITSHVADAVQLSDAGKEISFQLPFAASPFLAKLFSQLDANLGSLHIHSYGISVTTLEEVFLRVSQQAQVVEAANKAADTDDHQIEIKQKGVDKSIEFGRLGEDEDIAYFIQHIKAMLIKRAFYFMRDQKSIVLQYVVPLFFVFLALLIVQGNSVRPNEPSKLMTPSVYNKEAPSNFAMPFPYSSGTNQTACKEYINDTIYDQLSQYNKPYPMEGYPATCYGFDKSWPIYEYRGEYQSIPTNWTICDELNKEYAVSGQQIIVSNIENVVNFPERSVDTSTIQQMSEFLQRNADEYQATTFGAVSFFKIDAEYDESSNHSLTPIQSSTDLRRLEYFVHANYTAPFSSVVFNSLTAEAAIRGFDSDSSLKMNMHPLPNTQAQAVAFSSYNTAIVVDFILLATPCIAAAFASFVVREKETRSKAQQLVSGVSIPAYWVSSWLWDTASYIPIVWPFILLIVIFPKTEALGKGEALNAAICLLLLYGPALASFSYLCSFLFKSAAAAQLGMLIIGFMTGVIMRIIGTILRILGTIAQLEYIGPIYMNILRPIFCLFPPYAFGEAMINVVVIETWSREELPGTETYQYFDWEISGMGLVYLGWQSIVYLILAILIDYGLNTPYLVELYTKYVTGAPKWSELDGALAAVEDEDVIEEHRRVSSGEADETSVVKLNNVKKVYGQGKYAVKGLSLGIPNGECFGLLGINGAGKSTTLAMLSGEFPPSLGEAHIAGLNLSTNVHSCRRKIGFCPQFDALFELLTAREHLLLYARIKGIAEENVLEVVESKLREMDLVEYADRAAGGFSGGNKRKLSVAIAMIGEPSIVFLDEPSTGMDPVARRFMWEIITDIVSKREKCSVILTTHSMEECEALCSRVGIMVGGKLRCLGGTQRLRSLYGRGYQIEVNYDMPTDTDLSNIVKKILTLNGIQAEEVLVTAERLMYDNTDTLLNESQIIRALEASDKPEWVKRYKTSDLAAMNEVTGGVNARILASWWFFEWTFDESYAFLHANFEGFTVRERQISKCRFEIPGTDSQGNKRSLSSLFELFESNRSTLRLQDYSVSQVSLEQIFNHFASQQLEETGTAMIGDTAAVKAKPVPNVAALEETGKQKGPAGPGEYELVATSSSSVAAEAEAAIEEKGEK